MYQLAQINIAQLLAPLDSPLLADFVADLDRINAIAESSPGFVWRLKEEASANAAFSNPFTETQFIVNISVWESVEALKDFVYKSGHLEVYLKRAKWFSPMTKPHMALWWIKNGEFPTEKECKARLRYLAVHGETAYAFSFKCPFDAPEQ